MTYDVVPRCALFMILKRIGYGAVIPAILVNMYTVTQSVMGTAVVHATTGVMEGSPTSCIVFIIYT